jgi:hypothetical protein
MANKFNSVVEFCNNVSRGTFGISMITLTEPKMRKTNNPYFGRVHKASYMTNVALGYDYENVINAKLERKGLANDFVAEKPKGKTWDNYPFILQSDKDNSIKYLRCTIRPNTISKSVYLLDGVIVKDDTILTNIKNFISASSFSPKQANSGLEEKEQVIVRDYKVEGVIALSQGEKEFSRLGNINVPMLRQYFK